MKTVSHWFALVLLVVAARAQNTAPASGVAGVSIDRSGFDAACGVALTEEAPGLRLNWPMSSDETGEIVFKFEPNRPFLERFAIATAAGPAVPLMQRVDPVTLITIGERDLNNPAGWVAFFDNPPLRAHHTVAVTMKKQRLRVASAGTRTTVSIGEVTAGSFRGTIDFTVVRNSPLVFIETVVRTEVDGRALLYDAGHAGLAAAGLARSARRTA